ncbi:MAG: hypothetical protein IPN34_25355 [Planctomycetes bacterium]|nr:hypothetical protein [Planctomycetota bacterium]
MLRSSSFLPGLLLVSAAAAQTPLSGSLRDGAGGPLLSGVVYHVTGNLSVPTGQTLTIQAGAILKFQSNLFTVDGTLDVNGTAGSPVIFTSIHDDAAGGDTNGNGNATAPGPDQWYGISLAATASGSAFDFASVRYTGASFWAGISLGAGNVALRDCSFLTNNWGALALDASSRPLVTRCSFSDVRNRPAIYGADIDAVPGFTNCTVTSNPGGNFLRVDAPVVNGSISIVASNCVGGALVYNTNLSVPVGATLTLGPGVVIKPLAPQFLTVDGTLRVQGTAASPVVFTSIHDDAFGGDTNGNGSATAAGPDQWYGVSLSPNASASVLDHLHVRCTGAGFWAGMTLNGAHATLRDCVFTTCNWGGLGLDAAARPLVARCTFTDVRNRPAIFGADIDAVPGFTSCTATGNPGGNFLRIDDAVVNGSTSIVASNCVGGALVYNTNLQVPAGSTLTLGQGVVMKPLAPQWFGVDGTLLVRGASAQPVVLTSFHDDTYGGDTNNNGNATAAGPDQWYGLVCNGGSDASVLEHLVVRCTGAGFYAAIALDDADLRVQDSRFELNNWGGIGLDPESRPIVERCSFTDVRGRPAIFGGSLEALPGFRDNTASGCPGGSFHRVDDPTCDQAVTIAAANCLNGALVYNANLIVRPTGVLSLLSGVVLKPASAHAIHVDGQLNVVGPVTCTAYADDQYGGDTNNNGPSSGGPDQWYGIAFRAGSSGFVDQLLVRFTGVGFTPAISCVSPNVALRRTRVEHGNWGGFALEAAGVAEDLVAWDCGSFGIRLNAGSFALRRCTVAAIRGFGIERLAAFSGQVASTISYGNSNAGFNGFSAGQIRYSNGSGISGGVGNRNVDPLFALPAQGDLRISPYSSCVDAGDPADLGSGLDANGFPRYLDGDLDTAIRVDMGAFEHDNLLFAVFGDPSPGQTVTLFSAALPSIHTVVLILGVGPAFELPLFNYGPLFPNLFGPYVMLNWAPNLSVPIQIPLEVFTPVQISVQSVGFAGAFDRGNTSNPSFLVID